MTNAIRFFHILIYFLKYNFSWASGKAIEIVFKTLHIRYYAFIWRPQSTYWCLIFDAKILIQKITRQKKSLTESVIGHELAISVNDINSMEEHAECRFVYVSLNWRVLRQSTAKGSPSTEIQLTSRNCKQILLFCLFSSPYKFSISKTP